MKKRPTVSKGGSAEVQADSYHQARELKDERQSLSETGSGACVVYGRMRNAEAETQHTSATLLIDS